MINQHPIIPSTALLDEWCMDPELDGWRLIATQAAQWGSDQELEACKQYMHDQDWFMSPTLRMAQLHNARRPKPPTLKEQALEALKSAPSPSFPNLMRMLTPDQHDLIRRALEALPE